MLMTILVMCDIIAGCSGDHVECIAVKGEFATTSFPFRQHIVKLQSAMFRLEVEETYVICTVVELESSGGSPKRGSVALYRAIFRERHATFRSYTPRLNIFT